MAVTAEGLRKTSRAALGLSIPTAILGSGTSSSVLGFGGAMSAIDIASYLPHAVVHNDFQPLWPFGGMRTFDGMPFVNPTGPLVVDPHSVFYAYTAQQGFDLALGEATILLLVTAGLTNLASRAARRMSRKH